MMLLDDYHQAMVAEETSAKLTDEDTFTETQKELVHKFNAAFYEAQHKSSGHHHHHQVAAAHHDNILDTFDEKYFTNIEKYEDEGDLIDDPFFFDFLVSKSADAASVGSPPPPPAPSSSSATSQLFDYDDFCEKFEQQVNEGVSSRTADYLSQYGIMIESCDASSDCFSRARNPSTSTGGTASTTTSLSDDRNSLGVLYDNLSVTCCESAAAASSSSVSPFFVPLPFDTGTAQTCDDLENLDLSDIDLSESVSSASIDLTDVIYDYGDREHRLRLPPVNTIVKANVDFTNRLRYLAPDCLQPGNHRDEGGYCNAYGHLVGGGHNVNNNLSTISLVEVEREEEDVEDFARGTSNQATMRQSDALVYDDPLLSSAGCRILPGRVRRNTDESELSGTDCDDYSASSSCGQLQCKWENCFQVYESQATLVRHIEKHHVELKRGEEFTCFWLNCPRKSKPFNARYKLLIHMRVHSGEKPNKCPFGGCNKAFSRLENLKIHQRSHTGERPYLCQISNCTKSFSNSSDRAKHQRTHFDTKPYACQVAGCSKKYTDPSSLRKHVKNHTYEEQVQLKRRSTEHKQKEAASSAAAKKNETPPTKARHHHQSGKVDNAGPLLDAFALSTTLDHTYSNSFLHGRQYVVSATVRQDLKNKISEKINKEKAVVVVGNFLT